MDLSYPNIECKIFLQRSKVFKEEEKQNKINSTMEKPDVQRFGQAAHVKIGRLKCF